MNLDANGNVVLPKWFLGFLSIALTLVMIAVVPWAVSVTKNLSALANEIVALQVQFEARTTLREEVIQNINYRIERIERKLDRLERSSEPP